MTTQLLSIFKTMKIKPKHRRLNIHTDTNIHTHEWTHTHTHTEEGTQEHAHARTCRLCSCCLIFTWAAFLSALAAGEGKQWANITQEMTCRTCCCMHSHCLLRAFCMRSLSFSCGVSLDCGRHRYISNFTTARSIQVGMDTLDGSKGG